MDFNKLITILLFILLVLVCSLIIYSVFKIDESFKLENFQTESVDQKCLSKVVNFLKINIGAISQKNYWKRLIHIQ